MMNKVLSAMTLLALVGSVAASDVTYRGEVRAIVQAQCLECHGDKSPTLAEFQLNPEKYKEDKSGPRIDTYADLIALVGWPDSGALMRRLDDGRNTPDKKKGPMYKYLGETDAERAANLAIIKAWVGEGAWNLKRWTKRDNVPAVTKEELNLLKLKY